MGILGNGPPAFARLTIAVLPPSAGTDHLRYDEVVAAARTPVALGPESAAPLIIAGRLRRAAAAPAESKVTILVDGRPVSLTLPDADNGDWSHTVRGDLCRVFRSRVRRMTTETGASIRQAYLEAAAGAHIDLGLLSATARGRPPT